MAKRIYYSKSLEELAGNFADKLRNSGNGVFIKETIITQNAGIREWLNIEIAKAENNGIFTNYQFLTHESFLSSLYLLFKNEASVKGVEYCHWLIFGILSTDNFKREFPDVADYYANDNMKVGESHLKQIQLAAKLVTLFDHYQFYRQDIITTWEAGQLTGFNNENLPHLNRTEQWQKYIWLRLRENVSFKPRYIMRDELLEALNQEHNIELLKKACPTVNFFGNNHYDLLYLLLYDRLSEYIDIAFHIKLPFADGEYENELLKDFGRTGYELNEVLSAGKEGDWIEIDNGPESSSDTLLGIIQKSIYHNTSSADIMIDNSINEARLKDGSVQINSAYTPVREIEMLYNYLVDLVASCPELTPKDITVLVSDIEQYAPFIKAVFNNSPVTLPYTISGISNKSRDTVVNALVRIMDFEEEDFTSEKVVSLLENRYIMSKYQIADIQHVRNIIDKANIRSGYDGAPANDTRYVSWKYGLEKILLGYAMLTDEKYLYDYGQGQMETTYPLKDVESGASYDLFKMKEFAKDLHTLVLEKEQLKTISQWSDFAEQEVLDKMIEVEHKDRPEQKIIYNCLRVYRNAAEDVEMTVSFRAFWFTFRHDLLSEISKTDYNSGKVTFSAFNLANGLPNNVVAFLGLSCNTYPAKNHTLGFDLLQGENLPAGSNKREAEKYTFLETILAARKNLYLSFIGKNSKDNRDLPPSIVVDEFMDFIKSSTVTHDREYIRYGLLVEHPLHGFSKRYTDEENERRLFTYLYHAEDQNGFSDHQQNDISEDFIQIDINDLLRFFDHPVKWYFKEVLKIDYDNIEGPIPETELFDLDGLQKWQVKDGMLKDYLNGRLDDFKNKGIKNGLLPLKSFGELQVNELIEDMINVSSVLEKKSAGKDKSQLSVNITINNPEISEKEIRVTGNIGNIYLSNKGAKELVDVCLSGSASSIFKYNFKHKIRYWALVASGEVLSACHINSVGVVTDTLAPDDNEAACLRIEQLVGFFMKGQENVLLYHVQSFLEFLKKRSYEDFMKKFREYAYPGKSGITPDLYIRKVYDDKTIEWNEGVITARLNALSHILS